MDQLVRSGGRQDPLRVLSLVSVLTVTLLIAPVVQFVAVVVVESVSPAGWAAGPPSLVSPLLRYAPAVVVSAAGTAVVARWAYDHRVAVVVAVAAGTLTYLFLREIGFVFAT